ncbi:MAG: HAMP domain-containing protein [Planctomycetota bacterium]|jgi:signal transduction histidine kinase
MSIRGKIFLWFLLPSILIATSVTVFCYFYTRQIVKQNIFDQLDITADQLQKHVQVFLEGKERQTIDFSFDDLIRDCTEEITGKETRREYYTKALNNHLFVNKKPLSPNILEVFIVDFNGKVIASTEKTRIGENVSSEEYFSEVELSKAFTGELQYNTGSGETVIDISTVILSKVEQEAIGVLVNRVKFAQNEDGMKDNLSSQINRERNYSQLINVSKVWLMAFSTDGFIKDCTEEITRRDDKVQNYTDRLNNHLDMNKRPLDSSIVSIFVIDLTGKIIGATELGLVGKDVSGKEYFLETKKHGSFTSELHLVPGFEHSMFETSKLLTGRNEQEPIGMIVNRYNGDSLKNIFLGRIDDESIQVKGLSRLKKTGKMFVVNRNKLMITGSGFTDDYFFKQTVDTDGVRIAFENKMGMIGIYNNYRGIPILGASKYLEEMGWVILAEEDVSEAFAPIASLRIYVVIMGTTGIIVLVVIAIFLSLTVTRPINKLVESARTIADGDLTKRIKVEDKSEIGHLARSFDTMRVELDKSFRISDRHRKELQYLSERIILIQEEERNKLSRELHDQTGQALIALKTNLEVIDKLLPKDADESRKWLAESKKFLVETIHEIRSLSFALKPPMLDELGLVPTIESYSKEFSARTNIAVHVKSNIKDENLHSNTELSLYRMVQEALTNVVKHSGAGNVHIKLYHEDSKLVLSIEDDGNGFDIEKMWQGKINEYGIGLLGMRERFASAGADFQVYSGKGKGTKLIARCQIKL